MILFSTVFVLNFRNICAFPDVQLRHFVSTSWLFDHTLHSMLMISLLPLTFFFVSSVVLVPLRSSGPDSGAKTDLA